MRMTRLAVPIAIVGALIVLGGVTAGMILARDQAPPSAPPQSAAADIAVSPESPKQPSDDFGRSGQAGLQPNPAVPTSSAAKPQDSVVGKGTENSVIPQQAQHGQASSLEPRTAPGNGPANKSPTAKAGGDENQALLIPEKRELKYPNLGSHLDQLVAQIEDGEATAEEAAGEAPMHREESVAVTIYLSGHVAEVVRFLEENGGDPRNVGEDYIEAYVPVSLLGPTSEQSEVLRLRAIAPPEPDRGG